MHIKYLLWCIVQNTAKLVTAVIAKSELDLESKSSVSLSTSKASKRRLRFHDLRFSYSSVGRFVTPHSRLRNTPFHKRVYIQRRASYLVTEWTPLIQITSQGYRQEQAVDKTEEVGTKSHLYKSSLPRGRIRRDGNVRSNRVK
jgi:hypothetical protein